VEVAKATIQAKYTFISDEKTIKKATVMRSISQGDGDL
jgi:hypothetical protein